MNLVLLVALLLPSAPSGPTVSELYAPDTYRERADDLTVILSSFHASRNTDEPYLPFVVALGCDRKGRPLTFRPASFTLIDGEGGHHAAADYTDLLKGYDKLSFDVEWLARRPLQLGNQFAHMLRIAASFYPPTDDGVRTSFVQLSHRTWFSDVVYFPNPKDGLTGILTLRVKAEGMDAPVEVRFRVPVAIMRR
jgi:hypothetical protein